MIFVLYFTGGGPMDGLEWVSPLDFASFTNCDGHHYIADDVEWLSPNVRKLVMQYTGRAFIPVR